MREKIQNIISFTSTSK